MQPHLPCLPHLLKIPPPHLHSHPLAPNHPSPLGILHFFHSSAPLRVHSLCHGCPDSTSLLGDSCLASGLNWKTTFLVQPPPTHGWNSRSLVFAPLSTVFITMHCGCLFSVLRGDCVPCPQVLNPMPGPQRLLITCLAKKWRNENKTRYPGFEHRVWFRTNVAGGTGDWPRC